MFFFLEVRGLLWAVEFWGLAGLMIWASLRIREVVALGFMPRSLKA